MNSGRLKFILIIILIFLFSFSLASAKEGFPKLANYYLAWDVNDETAKDLAKWDLLILSPQAIERNPDLLQKIKSYNPNIKILSYLLAQEINQQAMSINPNGIWGQIYNITDAKNWWLRDINQNKLNWWPGTNLINVAYQNPLKPNDQWNYWLPEIASSNVIKSNPLWDGLFFDNCWPKISWLSSSFDLNNDGVVDSPAMADQYWSEGIKTLLHNARQQIGSNKIIICNGGTMYSDFYDGRMFESFPLINEGGWSKNLNDYQTTGLYSILNLNTNNTGNQGDLKKMRFGLASSLMGDGYFSFDYGDQKHGQLWWYDEYDSYLGKPLAQPYNLFDQASIHFNQGVWYRDFENGVAIVNSSANTEKLDFSREFEKIRTKEEKKLSLVNIVDSVTLQPNDGALLLKPIKRLVKATFNNGSFVRIFDDQGQTIRNGFFAYERQFLGGQSLFIDDVFKTSQQEIISADTKRLSLYTIDNQNSNSNLLYSFYPYGEKFNNGFNFAIGDLDNNGQDEIITSPQKGVPAHVKIFNLDGRLLSPGFFAYPKDFRGGADVVLADVNGDGQLEIITGAGPGGGPHVKIFNSQGKLLTPGFLAFEKSYNNGINLAAGDVNGDGRAEIIVSRKKGDSLVKVFDYQGKLLNQWATFAKVSKGVDVAVSDVDGNGIYEIMALSAEINLR
jgi:hypothetical protein